MFLPHSIKNTLKEKICALSLRFCLAENGWTDLVSKLRAIVPDISNQESSEEASFNAFIDLKRRAMHAFQCNLMLKAVKCLNRNKLTVVDIGDSAGTHMLYLRGLTGNEIRLETVSVNLDPRAIKKIEDRGLKAILCRAENLELEKDVNLFVCFEMLEHLHNPAIFLRRLAKRKETSLVLITVPYLKQSRTGLHHVRNRANKIIHAEEEHIFELNPEDWTFLMLHAGWKVVLSEIYYQYPRIYFPISWLLARFWRRTDFEGSWGVLLERDMTFSDLYQDWDE